MYLDCVDFKVFHHLLKVFALLILGYLISGFLYQMIHNSNLADLMPEKLCVCSLCPRPEPLQDPTPSWCRTAGKRDSSGPKSTSSWTSWCWVWVWDTKTNANNMPCFHGLLRSNIFEWDSCKKTFIKRPNSTEDLPVCYNISQSYSLFFINLSLFLLLVN